MKKTHTGTLFLTSGGRGFIPLEGYTEDIEIDSAHLNTALHGDSVEIFLHKKNSGRQTGEIVKILKRNKVGFAGVLEKEGTEFFVVPDDTKMYTDILIPKQHLHHTRAGQKVFCEIVNWSDPRKSPEGKITKIFGKPGNNDAEMHAIAMERGFDEKLEDKTEKEALRIKQRGITEDDYKERKDFRKTLTFTIDPIDAKDFDDAISFKDLGEGLYEVGIHIADVSHYVRPGNDIDAEAQKRATSVYLVDRTIPMLPEILSNDLCSLVPNKDRLTVSAVFVLDENANIKEEWYGRTVIHSQKRFTYEEAEISIKHKDKFLHHELAILNKIAKKLNQARVEKGALILEQEEVKFILNEKGQPIKIIKKIRGDSNKMIEELMLLANRKVAEFLGKNTKNKNVFVYRIHDAPTKEKTEELLYFLKSLGHKIRTVNGIIPPIEINKILKSLEGSSEIDAVSRAVIRSQAKAIYSTVNIGHFGLGFEHYTHFTSPIRRYPDIVAHRILLDYLAGKKINQDKIHIFENISRASSEQEKKAQEAERASIKYKQVEYMSVRKGKVFDGIVSGVSEWGLYIEEIETKSEGMIRARDMKDDYYVLDEKNLRLVGEKKKKVYRLGDRVKIKVHNVDLEKKTIDYVLV